MTNSARLIRGALSRREIDELNGQAWSVRRTSPGRARELSRLTLTRAEATGYRRGVGQARVIEGHLASEDGRLDIALEHCLAAIPDLEPDGPTSWVAWAHLVAGHVSLTVGEHERALAHYDLAEQTALAARDPHARTDARLSRALAVPDARDREPLLAAAVADLPADGPDNSSDDDAAADGLARAQHLLAQCRLDLGDRAAARTLAQQAAARADHVGASDIRLAATVLEAQVVAADGAPAAAAELVQGELARHPAGRDIGPARRVSGAEPAALTALAQASYHLATFEHDAGDLDGAIASLVRARDLAPAGAEVAVDIGRRLADSYAEAGDHLTAYATLRSLQDLRHDLAATRARQRTAILDILYRSPQESLLPEDLATELTAHVGDMSPDVDDATGLPTARRLEAHLRRIGAATTPRPVAVALVDIDQLSAVTAELGHLVGASALRQMARVLERSVPEGSFLARVDGENFAVVLDGLTPEQSREACERLRRTIHGGQLPTQLADRGLVVCIGVAQAYTPFDTARLLRLADDALYAAKETGRDGIVVRVHDLQHLATGPAAPQAQPTS